MSTPDGGPAVGSPAPQPSPAPDGAVAAAQAQALPAKKPDILSIFDGRLYDHEKVRETVARNDVLRRAEQRVEKDPWDTDAWLTLVNEARNADIDTCRCFFEKLLRRFPTSGRHWRLYLQREIRAENFGHVDRAFKALFTSELQSVEVHRAYLQYMKDKRLPRDTMRAAYEYAVGAVGMDQDSTPIWQDYLDFIKRWGVTNTFEEGVRTQALRHVYQEVVALPVDGVEQFWKEFDQFENGLNKILAKKLLQDKGPAYQYARAALRDRRARAEGLQRHVLATRFRGGARERAQADMWRALVEYEKTNPLRLEKREAVEARVIYQYRQWLLVAYHVPFVWFEYCAYVAAVGGNAAAEYDRALTALPGNQLVGFAWADYEESRKAYDKAGAVYERLLAPAPSPSPSDGGGEAEATAAEEKDKTLVYIQYMKFKRRTEGLTEARKVFKRARGDRDRVQHHVFVSNALLEYHADKKADVAERIFRFGLDNARPSLAGNAAYALEYLDFLAHLTEDNNTRVLYERVLTTVPREAQREIWARFLRFEADYGDLQAVLAVEARAREMDGGGGAGGGAAVCYAIHRYRYIDLVPVTQQELDYLGYNRCFPSSSSAPAGETPSPAPPAADAQVQGVVVPDVAQMVAYNPEDGMQAGASSAPQAVREALKALPAAAAFKGPYVNVVAFLDFLNHADAIPALTTDTPGGHGHGHAAGPSGVKREHSAGSESDEEVRAPTSNPAPGTATAPAPKAGARPNLFQKRMQKQFKPA